MLVKNVMTKNPVTISPENSITEAKALMTKKNIGKLPVIDKNNNLVGILTKKDMAKAAPSEATTLDMFEIGYLLSKITVEKIMTRKVVTVSESEVVENAAKLMVDNGIGCVPVVSGDCLVGIITESDLFQLFTDMFGSREEGVRFILTLDDTPGQLAKLVNEIAKENGNLVSLVTRELKDFGKRKLTVKVAGISEAQLKEILSRLNIVADDIR